MKTIGVIVNRERDEGLESTRTIVERVRSLKGAAYVLPTIAEELGMREIGRSEEELLDASEVVVCLGGDGTFLTVARMIYPKATPILGINLGNLGFLAEVDRNEMTAAVDKLIKDDYAVQERMTLETEIYRGNELVGRDVALNDIVISRGALSRILHIKTYINNDFVDIFPGDGLIVSSPTGSTAYSLSTGGPIVEPDIDLILVTPICPHILYSRSFITTGDRTVKAVVEEKYEHSAMVTVDGQKGYEVRGGDIIEVRKAPGTVKLVKMSSRSFFNVLRAKIYYRGESLKKDEI